jgi:hypothetical protein
MVSPRRKGTKTSAVVWVLLAVLLLGAGVLALNVSQRFRRVVQETNQVRSVVQEAVQRQEMLIKSPARKEFSAAFLQMAFGDNPLLLEQIRGALNQAIGASPQLSQGDVAMMLVTYRAEGELRDVAIHVFGNLIPEGLPAFSSEGYWRAQLPDTFYKSGQSMLSLLGREVMILANRQVEQKQREVLDAGLNNRFAVIQDYLHDPVSFIAVIPEPARLFSEQYRPYMAAVLVKGKVSMEEARFEMVALSFDPQKAQELAQLISDTRALAIGVGRIRYGESGPGEASLQAISRMRIRADGPTVVASMVVQAETIEKGLPRFVRALSKGINRIKRGPGFPS